MVVCDVEAVPGDCTDVEYVVFGYITFWRTDLFCSVQLSS